jgi:serine/threonine protein phosphatase PrpC
VFDGHAGGKCSKAICSTIPYQFCRDEAFATKLPVALKRAIQKTNEQFLEVAGRMRLNDGSTAVQIAIRGTTMTIANVGDSRAVLISGKKSITLTEDHKPSAPSEHRRIASFGGTVTYNTGIARVAGVLAVSRAFGNYTIRNLIRADPDVTQREITDQDHYLVLASDGLWDVFRAAEVADICYTYERHGVQRIADYLVQMSLTRGSMDNVTAVVVSLSRYHARMMHAEAGGCSPPDTKQLGGGIKDKTSAGGGGLFGAASSSTPGGLLQRPMSSGGVGASGNDSDRQHSRPHGSTSKSRPNSGYAVMNSNSSFVNRQKGGGGNTPSSSLFNAPPSTEFFDADEETLHGDLNEFNKSVDYSALNNHVKATNGGGGGVQQASRMHQRMKGNNDQGNGRSVVTRPRSSQQMKQPSETGSVSNGLFGDRSSANQDRQGGAAAGAGAGATAGRQQHSASPSNIMKRMFSRGGRNQDNKQQQQQQMFSNIGDENHGHSHSHGHGLDDNYNNRPMSGANQHQNQGGDGNHATPLYSSAHRRPSSGAHGSSGQGGGGGGSVVSGAGGIAAGGGGGGSSGGMRVSSRFGNFGSKSKNAPLLAFSGGSNDQNGHSQGGGGSIVDRVQSMGYSRGGLHSPINTRHNKK